MLRRLRWLVVLAVALLVVSLGLAIFAKPELAILAGIWSVSLLCFEILPRGPRV